MPNRYNRHRHPGLVTTMGPTAASLALPFVCFFPFFLLLFYPFQILRFIALFLFTLLTFFLSYLFSFSLQVLYCKNYLLVINLLSIETRTKSILVLFSKKQKNIISSINKNKGRTFPVTRFSNYLNNSTNGSINSFFQQQYL